MTKSICHIAALAALGFLASASTSAEVTVQPLVGKSFAGELRSLSGDKVVVAAAGEERALDTKDLQSLRFSDAVPSDKPGVWLELVDGSKLLAAGYQAVEGRATVELLGGTQAAIPTRSIRFVRFREQEGALAEQWETILKGELAADLLVIRKSSPRTVEQPGQEPRVVTETALDELDGVVLEIGPETAKFEFDGDTIPVSREKIEGIIYFHAAGRELPPAACRVTDAGGSTWLARSIALTDGQLDLTSTAGVEVRLPLAQVQEIDFSSGNVKFLGDLEAEATLADASFQPKNMTAAFKQLRVPRQGKSFGGSELSIGGEKFTRGLSLAGRTRLAYRVPEGMQWFRAAAGLDDAAGSSANVTLRILADSREVYQETFAAVEERKPRDVSIDVSQAQRLTIVVEDASGLDIGDQLVLGDARFTK